MNMRMHNDTFSKYNKILDNVLIVAAACAFLYLLQYQFKLIQFPWPIQYREGSILLATEALLKGTNPYNFDLQPYYSNSYGLVYNFFVLPFASVFGPSLLVHKFVAGFFTFATLATICLLFRRHSISLHYSLPTLVFLYSSLLYSKTSLAEPDSTGVFILVLSVIIPVLLKFSPASLAISILLAGIGFFTKPYFIFGITAVAISLIYIRSWKKFCIYTFSTTCVIILELFLLDRFCESYTINAILSSYNYGTGTSSWLWVWDQLKFIVMHDLSFFIALLLAIVCTVYFGVHRTIDSSYNHWLIAFGMLGLVFIVFLGRNIGAFATYFYQLPIPFLCIIAAGLFSSIDSKTVSMAIKIMLVLSMIATIRHYPDFKEDFSKNEREWKRAEQLVSTHINILNSPAIAPLLINNKLKVYDSGQTGMYFYGLKNMSLVEAKKRAIATSRENHFTETVLKGITEKKFDLIMTDREFNSWLLPPGIVMNYYTYKGFLTLEMPHNNYRWLIDIWEPKH